jgi:hypothetical protein
MMSPSEFFFLKYDKHHKRKDSLDKGTILAALSPMIGVKSIAFQAVSAWLPNQAQTTSTWSPTRCNFASYSFYLK